MFRGNHCLSLIVLNVLLLTQCNSSEEGKEQDEATTYSLALVLEGESVNAADIDLKESKIVNTWATTLLEQKEYRIEPEVEDYIPHYFLPYSWCPLRYYLEDLVQLELYKKAPSGVIASKAKGVPMPPSWEEFEPEEAHYPLVRKWLMDSYGEERGYGLDSINYLNPDYRRLNISSNAEEGPSVAARNIYNLLVKGNEDLSIAPESVDWREELAYYYQFISGLVLERIHPLIFKEETELDEELSEYEKMKSSFRSHERIMAVKAAGKNDIAAGLSQLDNNPVPDDLIEKINKLIQLTQEYQNSLSTKTAQLQASYNVNWSLLGEQEQQFFQQIFTHCNVVLASQEQLIKRLEPFQKKNEIPIAFLSLMDVLNAIDPILQSAQYDQYSELESYLYDIKESYYQRVREKEAAFRLR